VERLNLETLAFLLRGPLGGWRGASSSSGSARASSTWSSGRGGRLRAHGRLPRRHGRGVRARDAHAPGAGAGPARRGRSAPARGGDTGRCRTSQLDLFLPKRPAPADLAVTVARLSALVGAGRVGAPRELDSQRPEASEVADFDADVATGVEQERPGASRARARPARCARRGRSACSGRTAARARGGLRGAAARSATSSSARAVAPVRRGWGEAPSRATTSTSALRRRRLAHLPRPRRRGLVGRRRV
jgi:hypothetical protein